MVKVAPLPHEWMLVGIIGFFVSWLYVYNQLGETLPSMRKWGAAFMLLCIVIFVASVVNMSQATTDEDHLEELAIHKR